MMDLLPLEEAKERVLCEIKPLPVEQAPLAEAAGRILADDMMARIDLPHFDNSAMDGYAVHASDTAEARLDRPVTLQLVSRIAAGEVAAEPLLQGQCVRLFTGSALPPGADAVVMQEDTLVKPDQPGAVLILDRVRSWENIRLRGEDVKSGSLLLGAGRRVTTGAIALLGAVGLAEVPVGRRPMVAVLATGSELLEPGQPLEPGKIYESNRLTLASLIRQAGGEPRIYPIVKDSLEATREAVATALAECDALVTSGGVSVGDLDFVKAAFASLGGRQDFWKVAIKPGKPFVFGRWRDKPWFGLPGNPVSGIVTFLLLVRPALLRLQGATQLDLPSVMGTLAEPLANRGDRRHFLRVHLNESGEVRSTGTQASHILSSLAGANGLVDIPPQTDWPAGSRIQVSLLDL